MKPLLERLYYQLLWHGRWPLFAVLLLLTGLLLGPALRVEIEQDNESMRGQNPVSQREYQTFRELFGNDDLLLLGLRHPQLLTPQGLDLLQRLTGQIEGLPGVARVLSSDQCPDCRVRAVWCRSGPAAAGLARQSGLCCQARHAAAARCRTNRPTALP